MKSKVDLTPYITEIILELNKSLDFCESTISTKDAITKSFRAYIENKYKDLIELKANIQDDFIEFSKTKTDLTDDEIDNVYVDIDSVVSAMVENDELQKPTTISPAAAAASPAKATKQPKEIKESADIKSEKASAIKSEDEPLPIEAEPKPPTNNRDTLAKEVGTKDVQFFKELSSSEDSLEESMIIRNASKTQPEPLAKSNIIPKLDSDGDFDKIANMMVNKFLEQLSSYNEGMLIKMANASGNNLSEVINRIRDETFNNFQNEVSNISQILQQNATKYLNEELKEAVVANLISKTLTPIFESISSAFSHKIENYINTINTPLKVISGLGEVPVILDTELTKIRNSMNNTLTSTLQNSISNLENTILTSINSKLDAGITIKKEYELTPRQNLLLGASAIVSCISVIFVIIGIIFYKDISYGYSQYINIQKTIQTMPPDKQNQLKNLLLDSSVNNK